MLKRESTRLSLPKSRVVCGYEIKKMPLGAYLQAVEQLEDFPRELAAQLSPDGTLEGLIGSLAKATPDSLADLLIKAVALAPRRALALLATLLGVTEDRLLDDENVGLMGLADIVSAWIEVNDLENFMRAAKPLVARLQKLTLKPGSSD